MLPTTPRYLLLPAGEGSLAQERLGELGPYTGAGSMEEILSSTGPGGGRPGWIVVPPGVDGSTFLALLVRLAAEPGEWAPLLVTDEGGARSVVPVSPGFRLGVSDAADRIGRHGSEPAQLSFRMAAKLTSKLRHDINNPLTAALAEVQLLLMDVEPSSELAGTLRAVETQLRRIGELVAQLSFYRAPSP